ncbi:MAG: aminomethyl-transferring glycine dehydrogenase subunit GcvPA [Rhodospirillales bacterium]|jgi:glycine dehydrogenase subunit 1|nr:aminomethyl-transferring glycine dehydrogenase subunit GcvPA [Rhodospirillales bacterium]
MKNYPETAHPYMANSPAAVKDEMMKEVGIENIEELFQQIPADHRLVRPFDLPPQLLSEAELKRHMTETLARNRTCADTLSFLGGGCWQHYVPAVVDEISHRSETLTQISGTPQSAHGRNQAWFEYTSQLGELVKMEVVGLPVYSWGVAAGHALRMASRITGRREVLLPKTTGPERLSVIRNFCEPTEMENHIAVALVDYDAATGLMDVSDLESKISAKTAAVYFENPSYLGFIESQGVRIAEIARAKGAETVVGVDPISLGVLAAPADYGADIVVGTTQPFGIHMNCGGGTCGFVASRDEVKYVGEYPMGLNSIAETIVEGEYGFAPSTPDRTSMRSREKGKDWTGTSVNLWAVAGAVYMALLGPQGFREIGELIIKRANYAARQLAAIEGVKVRLDAPFFKEFVVNFDGAGKKVTDVNAGLKARGIFGGHDLSGEFPALGQSALYCVTEIHNRADLDRLADTMREVVGG